MIISVTAVAVEADVTAGLTLAAVAVEVDVAAGITVYHRDHHHNMSYIYDNMSS